MKRFLLAALMLLLPALSAQAADWLLAVEGADARAGAALDIELVRPDANSPWPDQLMLRLVGELGSQEAAFQQVQAVSSARRLYQGTVPAVTRGMVRVEAVNIKTNRLLLQVMPQQRVTQGDDPSPTDVAFDVGTAASSDTDLGLAGITLNEPSYFVLGADNGLDARYQFSMKYQIFDNLGPVAQAIPLLGEMYIGYTQIGLWDLSADSKPFRDTTYRPSLFWQKTMPGTGLWPEAWRAGYEHESNGKEGADSRSLDILFIRPEWRHHYDARHTLAVAPKFYVYLDKNENEDMPDYRGYADLNIRYGDDDGLLFSTLLRLGTTGKGSAQADVTWPFKQPILGKVGGFFHTQVFTGYGQTLLDYNQNADTQLRFGISLVR